MIEYLNAPADGDVTNPNGGVDWAEVRAANGHPKPYGVTRFEIGNEIGYYRQTYWMDGRGNTDCPIRYPALRLRLWTLAQVTIRSPIPVSP